MVWPVQGHETRLGCLDGGLRALDWTQRQLQGRTCTWSFFILFHPFFRLFPPLSFFFQIRFSYFSSSRMFTNNQSVSPQRECYGSSFSPSSPWSEIWGLPPHQEFRDDDTVLVGEVDCVGSGKAKCKELDVKAYPQVKCLGWGSLRSQWQSNGRAMGPMGPFERQWAQWAHKRRVIFRICTIFWGIQFWPVAIRGFLGLVWRECKEVLFSIRNIITERERERERREGEGERGRGGERERGRGERGRGGERERGEREGETERQKK